MEGPQAGSWEYQIDTSSSLVSGVAALIFDIVLLGLIKALSQSICTTANTYLLYDKNRSLDPKTSRFGMLTGSPVGQILLVRVLSVMIALSTVCAIILGFAIDGKTVQLYEPLKFRSLVTISKKPTLIDFENEAKVLPASATNPMPVTLASRRLVSASDAFACTSSNFSHTFMHGYAFEKTKLDDELIGFFEKPTDASCVEEGPFRRPPGAFVFPSWVAYPTASCSFRTINLENSKNNSQFPANFTSDNCNLALGKLQCYSGRNIACAGVAEGRGRAGEPVLVNVLVQDVQIPENQQSVAVPMSMSAAERQKYAANIAFLSAIGFGGELQVLVYVAASAFEYDVELERRVDDKDVCVVDLRVAIPVLVIVVVITAVMAVTCVWLWVIWIWKKGREGYNKFSTVGELLELAEPEKVSKFRRRPKRRIYVGVRKDRPVVGVLDREDEVGGDWPEKDVQ